MAVYKIFPTQDATLYSLYPEMNTGLDAICEISNYIQTNGNPVVSRYLTLFDNNEIIDVINNKIQGKQYDVFLQNFIATAQGINSNTSLEIYPIAQEWNNGTGEYLDSPQTTNGVSWTFTLASGSTQWNMSGSVSGIPYTGSYDISYANQGGGSWFYSGSNLPITESFGLREIKDFSLSVKNITNLWYSSSIPNYGFIIKLSGSNEFSPSVSNQPILKYYSVDTNTIYPPVLEFKWRDYSTVLTSSLTSSIVNTTNIKLALNENPGVFYPSSINRFRVDVSPLYPPRTFQTSSYFTNQYFLPTSSYYAIKDLDTNEYVVTFDNQYTQISADNYGNYFDVYMSGLEPERYYTILIKTHINGSTLIFNDQYYFKVVS